MTLTLYTDWQAQDDQYTAALMPQNQIYLTDGCVSATNSANWTVADYQTGQVLSITPSHQSEIDADKLYYSVSCSNNNGSDNLVQLTHDTLDSIMITPYKPMYYAAIVIAIYCTFRAVYKIFFR